MRGNKKLLPALIALCILILALAGLYGCGNDTSPPAPPVTDAVSSDAGAETIDLSLYSVIYSEDAGSDERRLASSLRDRLSAATGCDIPLESDLLSGADGGDPDAYEILIGRTNRSATETVLSATDYAEYAIKSEGHKIVVAGWLDDATASAIRSFSSIVKDTSDGKISPGLLNKCGAVSDMPRGVPSFEGGKKHSVTDTGYDSFIFTASSVSTEEYDAYISLLSACGWNSLYTNEISGSRFACFRDSESRVRLFVSLTAMQSKLRISAEPYQEYSADYGTAGSLPLQVIAGNCCDRIYYIRLPDGSIIVIDGDCSGTEAEKRAQTDAFVSELISIAGVSSLKDVRISAWIFTHVHTDHILMFCEMTSRFGSELNIGRILRNFPSSYQMKLAQDDATSWVIYFDNAVSRLAKQPEVITVHAGQIFTFSGVEFEYIYTHEDLYPGVMKLLNQTSTVFRMKYSGQTVLFTGDMADEASNQILRELGAGAVKCDAVQIGHHGWNNGGTPNFYRSCGASVMLWTNKYETWRESVDSGKLHYAEEIFNTSGVTRHIWCASGKTDILELPFG
ncbi:MAG: hypothetical protein SO533_03175 [Eubacteriales bacterium]|nr:hypothetical protein [Eubacteriales bacterium]